MGVLASAPAHGYDLKREYDELFPGAKPLAYGQVYASLTRLQRDGLVEVVETSHAGGPERTTYALTDAGRDRLREWVSSAEPAGPYAADDLVRKTVTALRVGEDATTFLTGQRAAHMTRMRELVAMQATLKDPESLIAIDHTISHLDADLRWLETATARVAAKRAVRR